ncbi:phosphotransferase family protein [Paenibacillus bouchesdurhonensis]|uniref:phosphotransferase family protein n=1 Tax=Paenibacillus bouchesdurhonensis TaxID=1870990 RepID=UPI001F17468B|nr:aminoglycoside phosphotransferase family protein [Paenibacillus bouchesdurhonensis]
MPESGGLQRDEALSANVQNWIQDQCGGGWHIRHIRPLKGGISSAVYEIQLQRNEQRALWVLRQYIDRDWLEEEPDVVTHETSALNIVHRHGIKSPNWIASDPDGRHCGEPSVLMTRLPGEVVLMPDDLTSWLAGIAQTLTDLHRKNVEPFPWSYYSYIDPFQFRLPDWTTRPEAWREIARMIKEPPPVSTPRFIHRDYHPANVLWERGQVSGVVDWVNACLGPPGIDVGHCRVNVVQLHGQEAADHFLDLYYDHMQGERGIEYAPYWDMLTLAGYVDEELIVYQGWLDLGVTHLHKDLLAARLDEYAESLLRRC